jgi:hypothetical protein
VTSDGPTVIDVSCGAEANGDELDPPPQPLSADRSAQQSAKADGNRQVVNDIVIAPPSLNRVCVWLETQHFYIR